VFLEVKVQHESCFRVVVAPAVPPYVLLNFSSLALVCNQVGRGSSGIRVSVPPQGSVGYVWEALEGEAALAVVPEGGEGLEAVGPGLVVDLDAVGTRHVVGYATRGGEGVALYAEVLFRGVQKGLAMWSEEFTKGEWEQEVVSDEVFELQRRPQLWAAWSVGSLLGSDLPPVCDGDGGARSVDLQGTLQAPHAYHVHHRAYCRRPMQATCLTCRPHGSSLNRVPTPPCDPVTL